MPSNTPDLPAPDIRVGQVNSAGGAVAAGGNVYDQRVTNIIQPVPAPAQALHQLRAPVADFVGRADELAAIAHLPAPPDSTVIIGIRGMGGIGKTELGYAAAGRLQAGYPDAQIVIELRGTSGEPMSAATALQTAIRAFDSLARLPDDLPALQALYRSRLSGKRVLILADDAQDAAQVRPLLPPPGCALLVTTRTRFSLPGMEVHDLGTLPAAAAEAFLLQICPRIGAAAPRLAQLCGYLPLALRVTASLLANDPTRTVPAYLQECSRLAYMRDPDDPTLDVDAVLGLSYNLLSAGDQVVLCDLSVFTGTFDHAAAVAVVTPPANEVDRDSALGRLIRRSFLDYDVREERYSLHDLVRAFAATRLPNPTPVRLRHARHYLEVGRRTEDLYHQGGAAMLAGLALFDRERAGIDSARTWAQGHAGDSGEVDRLLVDYAVATSDVCNLRYDKTRERIPQLDAGLAAARRLQDQHAETVIRGNLGSAYRDLGDAAQAIIHHDQQLALARTIGYKLGEAAALRQLGTAYRDLGNISEALAHYEQSLVLSQAIGDRQGEDASLGYLGTTYRYLGDLPRARDYYERRLQITRAIGDQGGEAYALNSLGKTWDLLGDPQRAADYFEQALAIRQTIGDHRGEAKSKWNLGVLLAKQGDLQRAVAFMQVRVDYERAVGHADAEKHAAILAEVRARLAGQEG